MKNDKNACDLMQVLYIFFFIFYWIRRKRLNANRLLNHPWFADLECAEENKADRKDDAKWDKFFDSIGSPQTTAKCVQINVKSDDAASNILENAVMPTPKKNNIDQLMIEYKIKYGFLPVDISDLMEFGQQNGYKIDAKEAENKLIIALNEKKKMLESEMEQGFGSRRVRSSSDSEDDDEDIDLEYHRKNESCAAYNGGIYKAVGVKNIGSLMKIDDDHVNAQKVPFQDVTNCVRNETKQLAKENNKKRRRSQYESECESVPDLENIPPSKKCRIS